MLGRPGSSGNSLGECTKRVPLEPRPGSVECHQQGTFSSRPFLLHASWQSLGLPGGREVSVQGTQWSLSPPSDAPQAQSRELRPTSTSSAHPPMTPLKRSHLSHPPPLALRSRCISPPRPWGAEQKQQVSRLLSLGMGRSSLSPSSPGGLWARAGVCSLQDLMPDGLRRSWCNRDRNKVHSTRNVLDSS